jgi:hypothetical protein
VILVTEVHCQTYNGHAGLKEMTETCMRGVSLKAACISIPAFGVAVFFFFVHLN